MNSLYRSSVLAVAGFPPLRSLLESKGMRMGVGRFVAGESHEEALAAVRRLEEQGLETILDLLGEFVDSEEGVAQMLERVLGTVSALSEWNGHLSVKPTQLGLGISQELALETFLKVAKVAESAGVSLCLDMENYPYVDGTLNLVEALRDRGYLGVSTVLQSYLRRTSEDLERLLALASVPAIRLVKGAYKESAKVAYSDKSVVDANYRELVYRALAGGAYVNVATHDESIIRDVIEHVETEGIGIERYEFQLLYGVKPGLQRRLAQEGHRVRIYVPFGSDWYGYFSRRLAERPANLAFVVRGLFG